MSGMSLTHCPRPPAQFWPERKGWSRQGGGDLGSHRKVGKYGGGREEGGSRKVGQEMPLARGREKWF